MGGGRPARLVLVDSDGRLGWEGRRSVARADTPARPGTGSPAAAGAGQQSRLGSPAPTRPGLRGGDVDLGPGGVRGTGREGRVWRGGGGRRGRDRPILLL